MKVTKEEEEVLEMLEDVELESEVSAFKINNLDGTVEYWINNKKVTKEEYQKVVESRNWL